MRFKREYAGDVVVLSPPRNLFGGDETEEIVREIVRQLAAKTRKFVIDLGRTANMNTKAISMFFKVRGNLEEVGATWAFCNVDRKIEHPLVVMQIVRLFNVCETRTEALSMVNRKAG
jgi:anti-anti-sigma regulatory factor